MKKSIPAGLILMFLCSPPFFAQSSGHEIYLKAMTSNDPAQRFQLLKQYVSEHPGAENENFAYATLCTTPFVGKTAQEALEYGEKALALGGLDSGTEYGVLITVAGTYIQNSENLDKAESYALRSIELAKAGLSSNPQQWTQAQGASHYVLGQALEKAGQLPRAVASYIDSYAILENTQIITSLAQCGQALYNEKNFEAAELALAVAAPILDDFGTTALLAKTLHRNDKKAEAVNSYKKAYTKRKNGEIAYNIGIILAGQSQSDTSLADEAVKFLLEASFLSPANSKRAMELAEQLYFNKYPKYNDTIQALRDKSDRIEQLTQKFNATFGNKEEEDLSAKEIEEMDSLLALIETENAAAETLKSEQAAVMTGFNDLVEETKVNLGLK